MITIQVNLFLVLVFNNCVGLYYQYLYIYTKILSIIILALEEQTEV